MTTPPASPSRALAAGSLAIFEDLCSPPPASVAALDAIGEGGEEVTLSADLMPPLPSSTFSDSSLLADLADESAPRGDILRGFDDDDDGFVPDSSESAATAASAVEEMLRGQAALAIDDDGFDDDDGYVPDSSESATTAVSAVKKMLRGQAALTMDDDAAYLAGYDQASPPAADANFLDDYDDGADAILDDDGFDHGGAFGGSDALRQVSPVEDLRQEGRVVRQAEAQRQPRGPAGQTEPPQSRVADYNQHKLGKPHYLCLGAFLIAILHGIRSDFEGS